ncbi:MAG TPA: CARDB domain-containing protein, partial [Candidatus Binatia bacterium]|nr:CARDB domain-containing protein [Candidatus Binatia bacterium]
VQVVRSGVPSGNVSVTATTVNGTAVAGQDYVFKSEVVTFQAGEIAKPFTVQILTQNASTRNSNRALTVALSNPVNADLNAANISTVTILDSRPDLIIASVSAPTSTLTGKAVSTPSTVKNIGPVAVTTPFSVGLYLVRVADYDPNNPRAGSLVASQDVPGLAAGASAAFPTSVMLDDSFPAGSYYLSAVANFDDKISEADTGNNGRSSYPAPIEVKKNLTKFKSASAAFSQSDPPAGPFAWPGFALPSDPPLSCDVTGSVNLTGTFAISNQQGNTATGQATLTGSLDDEPVQYVLFFTGTGDDNGNVSAVLNSVTFKSLVRNLTGSGNGSLTGTLTGRVLAANVSGQFSTSTGGACVFTGTLQALAQTSYQLAVGASRTVSSFGFGSAPAEPVFPTGAQGVGAEFRVFFDSDVPAPSSVLFTGPTGSGITSKPADADGSHVEGDDVEARYRVSRNGGGGFPGGKWTVLYKGTPRTFTLPPFNANASFVVVFPAVMVDPGGILRQVSWVYRDRLNGSVLSGPPAFMSGIGVQVEVNDELSGPQPESNFLSPTTTFFDLDAAGFTGVKWNKVRAIKFQYADLAGNVQEQEYPKPFQIQIQARLENNYGAFFSPGGSMERLLNVFVDVPAGSVTQVPCLAQQQMMVSPFFVQIQNTSAGSGLPYDAPTCIDYSGTASFDNNGVLTDIFSLRTDLNNPNPPMSSPSPPLMAGQPFTVDITPLTGPPVHLTVPLDNPETTEFIQIPNPATPTLKPSGPHLSDARLGQNQTISWTRPTSFTPASLFVSANVYTSNTGPGLFCSSPQPDLSLDATQATYKFLTSCFGQAVKQANVCVFYTGTNGEVSDACWFFSGP